MLQNILITPSHDKENERNTGVTKKQSLTEKSQH